MGSEQTSYNPKGLDAEMLQRILDGGSRWRSEFMQQVYWLMTEGDWLEPGWLDELRENFTDEYFLSQWDGVRVEDAEVDFINWLDGKFTELAFVQRLFW